MDDEKQTKKNNDCGYGQYVNTAVVFANYFPNNERDMRAIYFRETQDQKDDATKKRKRTTSLFSWLF
jgi:hypothetical protein